MRSWLENLQGVGVTSVHDTFPVLPLPECSEKLFSSSVFAAGSLWFGSDKPVQILRVVKEYCCSFPTILREGKMLLFNRLFEILKGI